MTMKIDDRTASAGYGLTTAQIIYRMPDHPQLFQEFTWQKYDTYPRFPVLSEFLGFWEEKIEGPIHSVTVAHAKLLTPTDFRRMTRPLN